jgi:hypothetical protein
MIFSILLTKQYRTHLSKLFSAGESGFPSECDVCGRDPGGEGHGQQYCRLPHEQSTHRASHRYLNLCFNTANERNRFIRIYFSMKMAFL